jgi:hypothetical protein
VYFPLLCGFRVLLISFCFDMPFGDVRLPGEMACAQSLLPFHNATASACMVSQLGTSACILIQGTHMDISWQAFCIHCCRPVDSSTCVSKFRSITNSYKGHDDLFLSLNHVCNVVIQVKDFYTLSLHVLLQSLQSLEPGFLYFCFVTLCILLLE